MTFSFLWWLSIAKAPKKKKKRERERERLPHVTNTLLIEVAFIFVWHF